MKVYSSDFTGNGMIPQRFTCQGDDINPHIAWTGAPYDTKSLALIVDDPDAPMGTWVHCLVSDINPTTTEIRRDSIPLGATQVKNDFRKENYGGPCPPSGVHRYYFRLYALSVSKLKARNKKAFYKRVKKYAIASAELMGRYTKG